MNKYVSKYLFILNLGITIIGTILVFGYLGYVVNHLAIGLIVGTIMAVIYLIYNVIRIQNENK